MIVYWSPFVEVYRHNHETNNDAFYLNFKEPEILTNKIKSLYKTVSDKNNLSEFIRCPSIIDFSKNTFGIRSPIDFSFTWTGDDFFTHIYDQQFYNQQVVPRDIQAGLFSLNFMHLIFFCESDLEMEAIPAFYENNDFVNNTMVMSGTFNVGKWFRPIDLAFFLKNGALNKKINIAENDTLMYIKFNTKENIKFKKFYMDQEISKISSYVIRNKQTTNDKSIKNYLNNVYSKFINSGINKILLKKIKENLME